MELGVCFEKCTVTKRERGVLYAAIHFSIKSCKNKNNRPKYRDRKTVSPFSFGGKSVALKVPKKIYSRHSNRSHNPNINLDSILSIISAESKHFLLFKSSERPNNYSYHVSTLAGVCFVFSIFTASDRWPISLSGSYLKDLANEEKRWMINSLPIIHC